MRYRAVALLLLGLCIDGGDVRAAIDCDKSELSADESAREYLSSYGDDCVADKVKARKTQWKLSDPAVDRLVIYRRVASAWKELSADFAKLTKEVAGGDLGKIANTFAERAELTADSLHKDVESGRFEPVSLYRTDTWYRARMILPAYGTANSPPLAIVKVEHAVNQACDDKTSAQCREVVVKGKQFMVYWALAESLANEISNRDLAAVANQVAEKDEKWNRYLYDSKPMLPFDFFMTDLIEKPKENAYLRGVPVPPERQWFLMHPSVGVEYASAAKDGQQMKPVLHLELFGVNYWAQTTRPLKARILNAFSGASIMLSYSDREGIKDTGFGVLLTFDNVYSVGVSRYGSHTGISVSVDLANMFREKLKPKYQALKDHYK